MKEKGDSKMNYNELEKRYGGIPEKTEMDKLIDYLKICPPEKYTYSVTECCKKSSGTENIFLNCSYVSSKVSFLYGSLDTLRIFSNSSNSF